MAPRQHARLCSGINHPVHIRQRIHDGEWKPGDRIPSEHELVAALGVSRMTVHRALHEMAEHGILSRFAGIGTFVAEERPQSGLLKITNIATETRARGHEYGCDVISVGRESANLEVASALDLHTGDSVFHAVCVHRENGVPIQIEDRYVNPKAAPDFLAHAWVEHKGEPVLDPGDGSFGRLVEL